MQSNLKLSPKPNLLRDRYLNTNNGVCPLGWVMALASRYPQTSLKILMSVIQSDAEGLALHT